MSEISETKSQKEHYAWLLMTATLAVVVVQLYFQEQLFFSKSGRIYLWEGDAWGSECSQQLFDPYSLTHFLHGLAFCGLLTLIFPKLHWLWRLSFAIVLESLWEMVENMNFIVQKYRDNTASQDYLGDTIFNSVGDIIACGIGFYVALKLGWLKSILLFLGIEILLIMLYRDSLLLNILMLTFPLEGIKEWQMNR